MVQEEFQVVDAEAEVAAQRVSVRLCSHNRMRSGHAVYRFPGGVVMEELPRYAYTAARERLVGRRPRHVPPRKAAIDSIAEGIVSLSMGEPWVAANTFTDLGYAGD